MEDQGKAGARIRLVQSDEAEPKVRLSPGKRYEVMVTTVVDSDFRTIEAETEKPPTRKCSFLPLCWGGCPKRHLDGSRVDVEHLITP